MDHTMKFVGMDVSKEKIAVAVADDYRGETRYLGMFPNTMESVRKLVKKLGDPTTFRVCYEAGPTGYNLYRQLLMLGIRCDVVAPGLIPSKPNEKVKTDKRDAIRLAQLYRAGELTSVYVPKAEDEALRDLVRARKTTKEEEKRIKNRISSLLLKYDIHPPEGIGQKWGARYMEWLEGRSMGSDLTNMVLQEELYSLHGCKERRKRYEGKMKEIAAEGEHASMIQALQCLRGIALVTAVSLVAEIGSFRRFANPKQLMAYTGLVPSEYSSGALQRRGNITKTGSGLIRTLLIEASWSYRYQPALKGEVKKRNESQPPVIQRIAWKAQKRLNHRYYHLLHKGKSTPKAVAAVARELTGFIWAIALQIEEERPAAVSVS